MANFPNSSYPVMRIAEHTEALKRLSGQLLLVGCDTSSIAYLAGPAFAFDVFAADRDTAKFEICKQELGPLGDFGESLSAWSDVKLPFLDDNFSVVIWAESKTDPSQQELENTIQEFERVLRSDGVGLYIPKLSDASTGDISIENWLDWTKADQAFFDRRTNQLTLWRLPRNARDHNASGCAQSTENEETASTDSRAIFQAIYDQDPDYGNAESDQCLGVRLLPDFQDWLKGSVLDLGCGRGQTVQRLRDNGFSAAGIDLVECHPGMEVGDFTKTLSGIRNYDSSICIGCVEHLTDDQARGLFENMQKTSRQAISIYNGPPTILRPGLHWNQKSFIDWTKLIREYFELASAIQIDENQVLYLTRTGET